MAAIFKTISTLCTLLPERTPRQFTTVSSASVTEAMAQCGSVEPVSSREVSREGDGDRRHASRLHHEQQRPAVEERDRRVKRLSQVRVLPADLRPTRGQLRVDERARERNAAAQDPRELHHERRRNLPRHDGRVHKDARPDDAAHHYHRRVEHAETPREPVT